MFGVWGLGLKRFGGQLHGYSILYVPTTLCVRDAASHVSKMLVILRLGVVR